MDSNWSRESTRTSKVSPWGSIASPLLLLLALLILAVNYDIGLTFPTFERLTDVYFAGRGLEPIRWPIVVSMFQAWVVFCGNYRFQGSDFVCEPRTLIGHPVFISRRPKMIAPSQIWESFAGSLSEINCWTPACHAFDSSLIQVGISCGPRRLPHSVVR